MSLESLFVRIKGWHEAFLVRSGECASLSFRARSLTTDILRRCEKVVGRLKKLCDTSGLRLPLTLRGSSMRIRGFACCIRRCGLRRDLCLAPTLRRLTP
jgi:hypothetical protein